MSAIPKHQKTIGADDDMELLDTHIAALRELGRLPAASDDQIYDFSIRCGTALVGRLRRLARYSALGLLDAADEVGFQKLCDEFRDVSAFIDRFELSRPSLAGGVSLSRRRLRSA